MVKHPLMIQWKNRSCMGMWLVEPSISQIIWSHVQIIPLQIVLWWTLDSTACWISNVMTLKMGNTGPIIANLWFPLNGRFWVLRFGNLLFCRSYPTFLEPSQLFFKNMFSFLCCMPALVGEWNLPILTKVASSVFDSVIKPGNSTSAKKNQNVFAPS